MSDAEKFQQIKILINTKINPALSGKGGAAEAVELNGDTLSLRVTGELPAEVVKRAVLGLLKGVAPDVTRIVDAPPAESVIPEKTPEDADKMQKIQDLFETHINPALAGHGGWAEVLDVRGERVFINVGGGCQGCGMASVTVKQGIQGLIQRHYPAMMVIDKTDHAGGTNPYYSPGGKGARAGK